MKVIVIPVVIGALGRINNGTGGLGNNRTSGDCLNDNIFKIGPNTVKSPGNLRVLAVTQTPMEDDRLILKNSQRSNSNDNYVNKYDKKNNRVEDIEGEKSGTKKDKKKNMKKKKSKILCICAKKGIKKICRKRIILELLRKMSISKRKRKRSRRKRRKRSKTKKRGSRLKEAERREIDAIWTLLTTKSI